MNRDEATSLLALSREADWTFPSSSGRPVSADAGECVERLTAERGARVEAATFLIGEGDDEAANELAANIWRLWVLARDDAGGRAFLARGLDAEAGPAAPTRARALALYGDGLFAFRQGAIEASRRRNDAVMNGGSL